MNKGKIIGTLAVATVTFGLTTWFSEINYPSVQVEASSKTSQINHGLADDLEQDKGWANGTLDENGNSTDSGTPYDEYAWANYIKKIKYKSGELNIIVEPGLMDLSKRERNQVLHQAQKQAVSTIGDYKSMTAEDDSEGFSTNVFNGGTDPNLPVATTKTFDNWKFKWFE